ncbi:MAG: hypothetical protein HC837_12735 [Chloroflexaceae bacterium]|nr:hypothetical protein [Chloroflexaceae bacterium]
MKHMHIFMRSAALLLVVLTLVLQIKAPTPIAAQTNERCFPETGYCTSGAILAYWESNGGLPVFGFPISSIAIETVEGWTGPVQWFERDRLEDHSTDGQGILAGRLGALLLEREGRPWETLPQVDSAPSDDCTYFAQTRHSLCEPFLGYWLNNGGLERFGYPISEPMEEQIGDWQGSVQYFERRRMEHHPEYVGTPYEVLLGLLGRMIHEGVFFETQGRIAFTSTRTGNQDIWVMDGDGNNAYNVTDDADVNQFQPDWSPDGSQIVYVSGIEVTQQQDIWIIDTDGSNARQLSDNPTADWSPAWSPDGARIAFVSDRNGKADIFVRNADGTGEDQNLTAFGPNSSEYSPSWSPDGSRIAFVSDIEGTPNIWVMKADGSEQYNLTNDNLNEYNNPTWTRDSARILYDVRSTYAGATPYIGYITPDRSVRETLYTTSNAFHPAVSVSGITVTYTSSNGDIYLANLDGSGTWNLTNTPDAIERDPAWHH